MYSVNGTNITLTRGDTFKATITATMADGSAYQIESGDQIRFAAKQNYEDSSVAIEKSIPTDTMLLKLDPVDTKSLDFGSYFYDIQLTKANGEIDTFIKGKLKLTEEVA